VIRGAEHRTNTVRQMLLYQACGAPSPVFAHLPVILKNGRKMSKRDRSNDGLTAAVLRRRELGYLPEATINYVALLGCSFPNGRERLLPDELVQGFALERLNRANAEFDEKKYLSFNAWYLRTLPAALITERAAPFFATRNIHLSNFDRSWVDRVLDSVRPRCRLLPDLVDAAEFFFRDPCSYEANGTFLFREQAAPIILETVITALGLADDPTEKIEAVIRDTLAERSPPLQQAMQTIRLALTGRLVSPGLFDTIALLGREASIRRLRKALQTIRQEGALP
jgi:glutamyl-tRNA synthetase